MRKVLVLVYDYDGLNLERLWETATQDIPVIKRVVENHLQATYWPQLTRCFRSSMEIDLGPRPFDFFSRCALLTSKSSEVQANPHESLRTIADNDGHVITSVIIQSL